jgi:recombination protein RecR
MDILPKGITNLIKQLSALPNIGPKTAERLTFYLLNQGDVNSLGEAVLHLRDNLDKCKNCKSYTDSGLCNLCLDSSRVDKQIVVVSSPLDIIAIERTGSFHGRYHVLHGFISPVDGIGPDDLEINSLYERIKKTKPEEVIIATNPNIEGETTALYLVKKVKPLDVKVTRLAHGLPVGGDLEYADQITLSKALDNRQEISV